MSFAKHRPDSRSCNSHEEIVPDGQPDPALHKCQQQHTQELVDHMPHGIRATRRRLQQPAQGHALAPTGGETGAR